MKDNFDSLTEKKNGVQFEGYKRKKVYNKQPVCNRKQYDVIKVNMYM